MEDACLVMRKKVNELQDIVLCGEVSGNIEHEASVTEVRPVLDNQIRKLVTTGISFKIVQSDLCVICTILICSFYLAFTVKNYPVPSILVGIHELHLRHCLHDGHTFRRLDLLQRRNHIPYLYIHLVIWEICYLLGRQVHIFHLKLSCLAVLLQNKTFWSPAVTLQWSVIIRNHQILTLSLGRRQFIPASMMQRNRTSLFRNIDMIGSKPKIPVRSFRSVYYSNCMNRPSSFRISFTFCPYHADIIRATDCNYKCKER